MKNDFCLILKALFVVLTFRSKENGLIRKLNVISNFLTSHTEKQVIIIQILPNISRNKGNQAIKVSHLIAYKVRNIFLQKPCRKCDRETSPKPPFFLEKKKSSYEVKASNQHLDIWTLRTRLGHIITAKFITFQNVHPVICSILIFIKGLRTRFIKRNISHFIFY